MKRTSLFLPAPMLARLKSVAATLDMTVSEIVRQAIEAWLKRQKEPK